MNKTFIFLSNIHGNFLIRNPHQILFTGSNQVEWLIMSVNNCQLTLPNNTDERRPQEHRGGSLTPRIVGIHLSGLITENIHINIKYYELFDPNLINDTLRLHT
jgi:hypothetical protein